MRLVAAIFLLFAAVGASFAEQPSSETIQPEAGSGIQARSLSVANHQMVAAANPLAAQAGLAMLRLGGSAADALVATQLVLGLVEPQSSGIGGGAFLLWYDAETGKLTTFDGRETAPAAAGPDLFLDADGKELDFFSAVVGGRAVGVPGLPMLLETTHRRFGLLPWRDLFGPAIQLAEGGFAVSPRLAGLIANDPVLQRETSTKGYFGTTDGKPLASGSRLRNQAYADTLRSLRRDGTSALYGGPIGKAIVEAVRSHPTNPGLLSIEDFRRYRVIEREAVCQPYRGLSVCGMGPPSSGGLTVGQILGMIEPFDLATLGPDDPQSWRILGDATRLAFADRGRFMADADFVRMPEGLLDAGYLASRSALVRRPDALPDDLVVPGEPPWQKVEIRMDGRELERAGTTHVTIVDRAGNVASMTSTIETAFGAHLMVGGFLLNNQLTDFSFAPEQDGEAVANRVEPGKRPRSSMAPTIVLHEGRPIHAFGSPGGSTIIPYVAKTLVALVDWKMDIQQAIALPHLVNRFGTYELEAGSAATNLADDLAALGYETVETELTSGLQGITIGQGRLEGGADPRREGVAVGD